MEFKDGEERFIEKKGVEILSEEMILAELPLYVTFQNLTYPKFISGGDLTNGLALAIHDIWACKIEITDYVLNYSKKCYTGNYRFTLYDNFGLDDKDIMKHEAPDGATRYEEIKNRILDPAYSPLFQSWYILQHLRTDKFVGTNRPFINTITFDEDFSGDVPAKWHKMMEEGVRQARGY